MLDISLILNKVVFLQYSFDYLSINFVVPHMFVKDELTVIGTWFIDTLINLSNSGIKQNFKMFSDETKK